MILILGLENVELLLNCILIKFTFLYAMHHLQGQSVLSDICTLCVCRLSYVAGMINAIFINTEVNQNTHLWFL